LSRKTRSREPHPALEAFLDEGLIEEVLYLVKSGKEATVHCCRGGRPLGGGLVAAKLYRAREQRSFRNDAVYQEGRVILDARARRAVAKKTRFGREAHEGLWLHHELEVLRTMHAAGLDVPQPLRTGENAILIEYFGDEESAAPPLANVDLHPRQARAVWERLLWNVEQFLALNWVHGDLSPYNVLYWNERAWIIDFPQAVDARVNRAASDLLFRDLANLCDYFAPHGIRADPERITRSLWGRYRHAEL
jgi:RIO kinase 1